MTYTYETTDKGRKKTYELQQSMSDAPLTHHPETGEPIKRVITGGTGFKKSAFLDRGKITREECKGSKFYTEKKTTVASGFSGKKKRR